MTFISNQINFLTTTLRPALRAPADFRFGITNHLFFSTVALLIIFMAPVAFSQTTPPPLLCQTLEFNGNTNGIGTGEFVEVPDPTGALNTPRMTIEAWVNWDGSNGADGIHTIVGKRRMFTGSGYQLFINNGSLGFAFIGSSSSNPFINSIVSSTSQVPVGEWTHVAVAFENGFFKLYINGELSGTRTYSSSLVIENSNLPLLIGREFVGTGVWYLDSRAFEGRIDEVRIWNMARTAAQIQAALEVSLTGSETGLLAYLPFNEGAGNVTADLTGSGFDGTLGGSLGLAPLWGGEDCSPDTSAPTLKVSTNTTSLWPPNHKHRLINLLVSADDEGGGPVTVTASVSCNELDDALDNGDGKTTGDIKAIGPDGTVLSSNTAPVVVFDPAVGQLYLRAERSGTGLGRVYTIAVTAVDEAGNEATSTVEIIVSHDKELGLPDSRNAEATVKLLGNYPNPFNPATVISYNLKQTSHVRMAIYNLRGQMVRLLVEGRQEAGRHDIRWDGLNSAGGAAATGLYLYRLEADSETVSGKMLLAK